MKKPSKNDSKFENSNNEHTNPELLEKIFSDFDVEGKIKKISHGPVVTLYEFEPAPGIRVSKIINLSDDIARNTSSLSTRVATIPGKNTVGIEIPNQIRQEVFLNEIISDEKFKKREINLPIALGKSISGLSIVGDLNAMPHLLIAGTTGSGKSVCINTIILSILYKAKPDEVKFILLDPKKLELSTYKSLVGYHLMTSSNLDEYVMTTPDNSVAILNSAIVEMERRFQVFSDARVRNISEYHDRKKENPDLETVPYVVVVIDELADLMLTSGCAIEEPITRLVQ